MIKYKIRISMIRINEFAKNEPPHTAARVILITLINPTVNAYGI